MDYTPQQLKSNNNNTIKLRFGESSRSSLTGLSVLLRNAVFIFTRILMNSVGSILGIEARKTKICYSAQKAPTVLCPGR